MCLQIPDWYLKEGHSHLKRKYPKTFFGDLPFPMPLPLSFGSYTIWTLYCVGPTSASLLSCEWTTIPKSLPSKVKVSLQKNPNLMFDQKQQFCKKHISIAHLTSAAISKAFSSFFSSTNSLLVSLMDMDRRRKGESSGRHCLMEQGLDRRSERSAEEVVKTARVLTFPRPIRTTRLKIDFKSKYHNQTLSDLGGLIEREQAISNENPLLQLNRARPDPLLLQ